MFIPALVIALVFGAGINAGFEHGQENPNAKSIVQTVAKPKPAEGPFGVDAVK